MANIFSAIKFNYLKEAPSALGEVDFGVLTVAMMIAALDGTVQASELRAFRKLADECRVSACERAAKYENALHAAGYILLLSRAGYSAKALSVLFLAEAERVLPCGFAGGKLEDIRRALVIWVSMGLSDGEFSGIERLCVKEFCKRVAEIMRKRRDCQRNRLWLGLCARKLAADDRKTKATSEQDAHLNVDLLAEAEKAVLTGDLATVRKFIQNG